MDNLDYLPFGELYSYTPLCTAADTTHKFTGQERDSESNLDNFIARYYSSAQGRFMSPDPLAGDIGDPQTLNRYAYVRNNPLILTDPSGMQFGDDGDGGFGIGIDFPCLEFCGDEGGGRDPQPPISTPADPGPDPNPPAGDPDPNGPFSGPVWQEGGPQIAPTGNLAALLGLQMPSPFIIDNWTNNNGTIVGDYNGERLCSVYSSCIYWSVALQMWGSGLIQPTISRPQTPKPIPQTFGQFASCMAGQLADNFFGAGEGSDDRTETTLALNLGAALALGVDQER